MNTKDLESLFTSKTRVALLKLFFLNIDRELYIREIEKETGISIGPIQHEIKKLTDMRIVTSRSSGNRIYYKVNKSHIIYNELLSIVKKCLGLIPMLKDEMNRDGILVSFIYGSYARNKDTENSDIDIFIVGNISAKQLSALFSNIPSAKELNYNLMTSKEFRDRFSNNDPFIKRILSEKKIYLKGNDETLRKIIG